MLPESQRRFARQAILPGVGVEGQARLARSHAAIVGIGALGCVIADLLARAGVGTLTLVDRDVVEMTNLQRQTLFSEADARAGTPKAEAAAARIAAVNSQCRVFAEVEDLRHDQAERVLGLFASPDDRPGVIVDGTDNFQTRYLLNDLAIKHGVPLVYGGAVGTVGTQMTIVPGVTPCLRCIEPEVPGVQVGQTCDTAGIFAPASSIVASCEAGDAIKVLLGRIDLISGTLLQFDLWSHVRRRIKMDIARDLGCICCGQRTFEFLAGLGAVDGGVLCGRNSVQLAAPSGNQVGVELAVVADRLRALGSTTRTGSLVRASIPGMAGGAAVEITVFADGRTIVSGTTDVGIAKAIAARVLGG